MNKEELKKLIKPLVKECISEVLLEEGLKSLSKKEVVKENIEEKPVQRVQNNKKIDYNKIFKKETVEKNKKFGFDMESTGFNPFQGTIPNEVKEKLPTPQDKVVGNLISESSGQWNKILDAIKARK